MKKKIAWMLLFICSWSFFSAAKQSGKTCDKAMAYKPAGKTCAKKKLPVKSEGGIGFDLSPLNFFLVTM